MQDDTDFGFERVSADSVTIEGRTLTVGRLIHAPAADIFELLQDPAQQIDADGMDMLRGPADGTQPIEQVGDVFTMHMHHESQGGDYDMENHVTKFEQDSEIAWMPARPGKDPHGVQWTWTLEPEDDESTYVTLTYDWEQVTSEQMLAGQFPPFPVESFQESLDSLADAVEDEDDVEWDEDDEALDTDVDDDGATA